MARLSPAVRKGVIYLDEIGEPVYIDELIESASQWSVFIGLISMITDR